MPEVHTPELRSETMDGWQSGIVHSFLARRPV